MGGRRFDGVVELDVRQLGASHDEFLRLRRKRVPTDQIVEVFLHDNVATTGKGSVLPAHVHGVHRGLGRRVLGSIHEAHQIAVVEVSEAVDFIGGRDGVG